jgi:DtxR family Mn-dependent transcriptional regulator
VLEAIDRLVGHPGEDPHGHVIPDRAGRIRRRSLTPLATLGEGQRAVVREIREATRARMDHWKATGLVPGAAVRMRAVRVLDDVFEIDVRGERVITGSEGLEGIWVEPAQEKRHERSR